MLVCSDSLNARSLARLGVIETMPPGTAEQSFESRWCERWILLGIGSLIIAVLNNTNTEWAIMSHTRKNSVTKAELHIASEFHLSPQLLAFTQISSMEVEYLYKIIKTITLKMTIHLRGGCIYAFSLDICWNGSLLPSSQRGGDLSGTHREATVRSK